MKVIIGSARIDEKGNITGGMSGDNNGKEVMTEPYYQHELGWYCLRPTNPYDAINIAVNMDTACCNDNIGYNQNKRTEIYSVPLTTTKAVSCDCSSLVTKCVREALRNDFPNSTTYNLASNLEKSGRFNKRFEVTNASQLMVGDVLVTKGKGHCAIVVRIDEEKVTEPVDVVKVDHAKSYDKALNKSFETTGNLHLRVGASVTKRARCTMPKGSKVRCYGYFTLTLGTRWLLVKYKDMTGFCSEKYLKEVK